MNRKRSDVKIQPETWLALSQDVTSSNASGDNSHLQALSRASKFQSLAGRGGFIVAMHMWLPPWVLITCGIFALAGGVLRATIPQESADRLEWWGYVLQRERQPRPKLGNRPPRRLKS
jgi:hypothetical protein